MLDVNSHVPTTNPRIWDEWVMGLPSSNLVAYRVSTNLDPRIQTSSVLSKLPYPIQTVPYPLVPELSEPSSPFRARVSLGPIVQKCKPCPPSKRVHRLAYWAEPTASKLNPKIPIPPVRNDRLRIDRLVGESLDLLLGRWSRRRFWADHPLRLGGHELLVGCHVHPHVTLTKLDPLVTVAWEPLPAHEHLIEDQACGKDVGCLRGRVVEELRSHVLSVTFLRVSLLCRPYAEPEVPDLDVRFVAQEQVLRLEVQVHQLI
mmetsp:Transcript_28984/g.45443  ORF Transcript_28984/g.45443 Transcript_28984/m.45443 type:complete len:259 (-) Transcript_28984:467-1243(-)